MEKDHPDDLEWTNKFSALHGIDWNKKDEVPPTPEHVMSWSK